MLTKKKPRNQRELNISLSEQAYQKILDQILRGTLTPGAAVSRRNLAGQFGMSFIPVGAALQRLERDGLVESRPRAGTRVKIPTLDEIRGRFEMREALECQSARLCAERMTFQEQLDLKRAAEHMDTLFSRIAANGADEEMAFVVQQYHTEFHSKIALYARSQPLCAAIESNHVLVFNWLYSTVAGTRAHPKSFHLDLAESICTGDPQVAESAMRAHVRFGIDDVLQAFEPRIQSGWRGKH
ncbi:GntR family transcriptional regulator [Edaphobacter bradus]|uniref:GntR family transcriptional regulator n=1 Tax=Edaphobacter bradus TaxID=2259016 RepID=UPI0021E017B1|nr:GntR family transcriptional regulator [Edaphobacter bradus]